LFFKCFAEPSAKNFRSEVDFLPALFRLMMKLSFCFDKKESNLLR
jgi:hypothetical protein